MAPAASVSGLYFAHPSAFYFSTGKIAKDQVRDMLASAILKVAYCFAAIFKMNENSSRLLGLFVSRFLFDFQVSDYASRSDRKLVDVEKWLSPVLSYDVID